MRRKLNNICYVSYMFYLVTAFLNLILYLLNMIEFSKLYLVLLHIFVFMILLKEVRQLKGQLKQK